MHKTYPICGCHTRPSTDAGLRASMLALACAWLVAPPSQAQTADPANIVREMTEPIPIEPVDRVFLEDLTWVEIRDAIKLGKTTVIVPTGGLEPNGPYVVTGKHNYVAQATSEAIARKLGNALVAPVVKFVNEGSIDPPEGWMLYPGTISVSNNTYGMLLEDICRSLRRSGFVNIVLIEDSGGNERLLDQVASNLNGQWKDEQTTVHHVEDYYRKDKWSLEELGRLGVVQKRDVPDSPIWRGIHDDFHYEAILLTIDPTLVRMEQRVPKKLFTVRGVNLNPIDSTRAIGQKLIEYRADLTSKAIQDAIRRGKQAVPNQGR